MGCPIVTKGTLWHSCVKVRAVIELPFGVMSWVGPGIGVLHGVEIAYREGEVLGVFLCIVCSGFLRELVIGKCH